MTELRHLYRLTIILALVLLGCGSGSVVEEGVDTGRLLASGRRDAAHWIVEGRGAGVSPELAIQLGYLERLRLGLGSPFRLVDFVMRDPRLEPETRRRTAHALLARTVDRQSYQIDPMVLDLVGSAYSEEVSGRGLHHLRLIEGAISEAADPRTGELAVRLAYALAAAEGSIAVDAPRVVTEVAALIRDRELARRDAKRLIRAAEEVGADPADLTLVWRIDRRFEVEAPPLSTLTSEAEREAIEFSLRLARTVQGMALRLTGLTSTPAPKVSIRASSASLLGESAARVLSAESERLQMPPRTPVVVAVGAGQRESRSAGLDRVEREALDRYLAHARDEEALVAEYALMRVVAPGADRVVGRAVVSAAVGLRTYAQERVWFPGFGGPSSRELEDRFGLAAIGFDNDLPAAWRPFYRMVLADALGELQRVLPSLNLRGLSFHLGASRGGKATLAMHDPLRRTIYLTPETGMGALAHEVAHDLDWQVALRRFRVRGDYASDRAVRGRADQLAYSLQRLTTATLRPPIPGDPAPVSHADRPAEVFARSMDWFVLVSLAAEGRSNGFLTSAQDALLTGYGTAAPPEISGLAGQALVSILDEIAPIYPDTREWYLKSYGPSRALTPYDLVRRLVETEVPGLELRTAVKASRLEDWVAGEVGPGVAGVVAERFEGIRVVRAAALGAAGPGGCRAVGGGIGEGLGAARRRLIARAAEARGRGVALHYAELVAGAQGREWLSGRLMGAPWARVELDSVVSGFLSELAGEVRRLGELRVERGTMSLPWSAAPGYARATAGTGWGRVLECSAQPIGRPRTLYAWDVGAPDELVELELEAGW